jgi:hypothetical protein
MGCGCALHKGDSRNRASSASVGVQLGNAVLVVR